MVMTICCKTLIGTTCNYSMMVRTKYSWSTTKKALALGVQKPNQECSITGWYRHFCMYKTNRTDPWTIPHSKWRGFAEGFTALEVLEGLGYASEAVSNHLSIYHHKYTCTPIDPQKISKNYIYPNSLGCSFVSSRGTVRVKLSHVKYQHESYLWVIAYS